tara:strand:+ start:223 stop:1602 length:1380 start_codon:yes stop_codon:yes gene_type:complete
MALTRLGTNAITTVPNSAITLDAAEIPNLDAAKITTGTLADARISASSVTQHSAPTDLQPIKSDISALALREATNESSAAFNLPNQFIDTFTDDTNLGTQTDVDRVSGYITSVVSETGLVFLTDGGENESSGQFTNIASGSAVNANNIYGDVGRHSTNKFGSYSHFFSNDSSGEDANYVKFNASSDWNFGTGDFGIDGWLKMPENNYEYSLIGVGDDNNTNGNFYLRFNEWQGRRIGSFNVRNGSGGYSLSCYTGTGVYSDDTWFHFAVQRNNGVIRMFANGVSQAVTIGSGDDNVQIGRSDEVLSIGRNLFEGSQGMYGYLDALRIYKGVYKYWDNFTPDTSQPTAQTASATGTLIQSANAVGSAKTKVGGTMLYKDNAGTATLGTDLKIYFTCNGGSNWTEASSYSAITPVYSTGIKQVRLGETTCTSGTDIRYKAVWANQAIGSKETQLHGIGVNY